jgi:RNA polymerase primary sigma factor
MKKEKAENQVSSSLAIYFKEINNYPLLSREEEKYYSNLASNGDSPSKKKLINSNLRFVVNVAKHYKNCGLPLEDLISEGNIGLIKAVDKFDVEKGYHFISYAVWWIKQSITKAISEKSRTIRIPVNKLTILSQIEKVKKKFYNEGTKVDLKDIAYFLNMGEGKIKDLINISKEIISLDNPVYIENNFVSLKESVHDEKYKSSEEIIIEDSLKEEIVSVLETLSSREKQILEYRFGLNGKFPSSLKQIGKIFHLSRERVRQIEAKALFHLRENSQVKSLKNYLID